MARTTGSILESAQGSVKLPLSQLISTRHKKACEHPRQRAQGVRPVNGISRCLLVGAPEILHLATA